MKLHIPAYVRNPSVAALLIANLVPLGGVIFFQWDVFYVLFSYIVECMVIGIYNIIKLILVAKWMALVYIPMFIMMFYFVILMPVAIVGGLYDNQHLGEQAFHNFLAALGVCGISFAVSHGISFARNYLARKEYAGKSAEDQFIAPFKRIFLVVAAAILGALLIMTRQAPALLGVGIVVWVGPLFAIAAILRVADWLKGKAPLFPPVVAPLRRLIRKITVRHLKIAGLAAVVLAILLVSPVISMLALLVVFKMIVDLREHLKEHPELRRPGDGPPRDGGV
jgi:hypothetical protein